MITNPAHAFSIKPWSLEVESLGAESLTLAETLFSLANGYMGTRGTFEESLGDNPTSCEGTYLNGLYMRDAIHYEEVAYGFATHNHKMLQVPDAKAMRLHIDGIPFVPSTFQATQHSRKLDFREGVLERTTSWHMGEDRTLEIYSRRIISFANQHAMAIEFSITPHGFSPNVTVDSLLGTGHLHSTDKDAADPRAGHISIEDSLRFVEASTQQDAMLFLHESHGSNFVIGSACMHHSSHKNGIIQEAEGDKPNLLITRFNESLRDGETLKITKFISYHDGHHNDDVAIKERLHHTLGEISSGGFNLMALQQKHYLDSFWKDADIVIEGDASLQQGIRFNLFHIFQSSGRDGKRAIAAKGLSGPGYDGHYFWDTEIYIVPFFIYSAPNMARKLLEYRYSIIDESRARARTMSHERGALYAWRTIGGEECSAYFPAGTAQYHINAAIAYAILQYHQATDDWDFMCRYGAEMLFETARIWSDLGHFNEHRDNKFCMNEVTGPDEYSAMVDNNFYTNAMARHHMRGALNILSAMRERHPEISAKLEARINLEASETKRWEKAVEMMYLPYDEKLNINPQDDGFLSKPRWDFAAADPKKHPLLLHYHPLVIHRHQVLKQADVVLAMALLGHEFPKDLRVSNLDYYTPLTTHDSTLSTCIYSVEASRAGRHEEAYHFFSETARMDIDNLHKNTEYGLHTACMAGSWMSIVMGFAGMEVYDDALHFDPHVPQQWKGYHFNIMFKGSSLTVRVTQDATYYTQHDAKPLLLQHKGQAVTLKAHTEHSIPHQLATPKKKASS